MNSGAGGFREQDAFEARAIAEVFGAGGVPVFAPAATSAPPGRRAGWSSWPPACWRCTHGAVPGTLNHAKAGADCPVHVHTGNPRPVVKPYALKVITTDLGQVAAVVVKRFGG